MIDPARECFCVFSLPVLFDRLIYRERRQTIVLQTVCNENASHRRVGSWRRCAATVVNFH